MTLTVLPSLSRRLAAFAVLGLLTACAAPEPEPVKPAVFVAPAPVVEVVQPSPLPAPPPPQLRFAGHVASYKTMAEAEAAWPRMAERFPVLREASRRYVEVDLGGQRGKVLRLLVGGFPDQSGAMAYCRSLRGSGLYCAPHDLPPG